MTEAGKSSPENKCISCDVADLSTRSAILTAILFAAGEPVSAERLAGGIESDENTVHAILQDSADNLAYSRSGIRLIRINDSWQMCTAPEYAAEVRKVLETRKPPRLSQTALEVLSIIAYRQPVTRGYIEKVRGVDSSYTVNSLCEKGIISECGRLDVPGKPILYKTTEVFLRMFGIQSLTELPELEEPLPDKESGTPETNSGTAENR